MNEHIDFSAVATNSTERMAKLLADTVFELEQWKHLAQTAVAERDQLRIDLSTEKPSSEAGQE